MIFAIQSSKQINGFLIFFLYSRAVNQSLETILLPRILHISFPLGPHFAESWFLIFIFIVPLTFPISLKCEQNLFGSVLGRLKLLTHAYLPSRDLVKKLHCHYRKCQYKYPTLCVNMLLWAINLLIYKDKLQKLHFLLINFYLRRFDCRSNSHFWWWLLQWQSNKI